MLQGFDLASGNGISDGQTPRSGRDIVIHGSHGAMRLTHTPPGSSQAIECLRRSHLVHQMEVYIKERTSARRLADYVAVPDLLE